jgi:hypothetical protein
MNTLKFLVAVFLAMFISLCASNSMMVHTNARIVLATDVCPEPVDASGDCIIYGNFTRNFLTGDIEVEIPKKSILLVRPEHLRSYAVQDGQTTFLPLGPTFSFIVSTLILIGGLLLAFRAGSGAEP